MHLAALAAGERRFVGSVGADENDGAQPRQPIDDGDERLGERRRGNDCGGAAVAENVAALFGRKQRVERQHHDAGAHAAPERHREIDVVVKQKREPFLRPQSEFLQGMREGAALRLQFAIAQRTIRIGESDLFGKPARDLRIDEVGDGVIRPALQEVFQHGRSPLDAPRPAAQSFQTLAALLRAARKA